MKNLKHNEENLSMWFTMLKTSRLLNKLYEKDFAENNITPEQVNVLFILTRSDEPVNAAEISRLTYREPHTISTLLSRMEKNGLITKKPSPTHRNILHIFLTDKGQEAIDHVDPHHIVDRTIGILNKKERDEMHLLCKKILAAAQKTLKEKYGGEFFD